MTNERLPDLAYSDDIAPLSKDFNDMNRMTDKLKLEAGKMGLETNKRKTNVMAFQLREDVTVELGGEVIDEVDWFEYLSSVIRNNEDIRKEVGIRVGKAGAVFSKMERV